MNRKYQKAESIRQAPAILPASLGKGVAILAMSIFAMTGSSDAAVLTSAGDITGIAGSAAVYDPATLSAVYGSSSPQTDGVVHIVLDLGSVQYVDIISFVNRASVATNFAIASLEILVATDEGAEDFDPLLLSSYTSTVYANQNLMPYVSTAGAVRNADIVNSQKQYFLINFTQSFHTAGGSFSNVALKDRVQFSDIRVTTIPEPGAVVLLGIAGAAGAFFRWRRQKLAV